MEAKVRILILEDNPSDAELMKRELRKGGLSFTAELAQDESSFSDALDKFVPDIILADYSLPGFDGLSAAAMARQRFPETPVVIVSGAIGEETAIEALKAGATDYVLKDRLKRIVPVVDRALNEARLLAEHKKAEETVHQQAELLRISFDAIIVWRLNGSIETWNRGAAELYGFREQEALGRVPAQLLGTLYPIPWSEIESALHKHGQWEGELRHKTSNGAEVTVLSRLQVVRRADGSNYVLETNRDISERKLAEQVLRRDKVTLEKIVQERTQELLDAREEMDRSKRLSDIGVLAAIIAHELRNPLAAIGIAASNIKRKAKNQDLDRHVSNIEKKVVESDQIISNLLFYSRIRPPVYESMSLSGVLEECAGYVEKRGTKRVFIVKRLQSIENELIDADPVQMKEVFANLLNNAYDAVMEQEGRIEIVGSLQDELIQVSIKDNGVGIDRSVLARVFDPFFSTKAKGTGLGLSVCRQIVSLHKGSINIESEPGKGTCLTVRLPKKGKGGSCQRPCEKQE